MFVAPLAAVITSITQSIICEFAGIITSVTSAANAPPDNLLQMSETLQPDRR